MIHDLAVELRHARRTVADLLELLELVERDVEHELRAPCRLGRETVARDAVALLHVLEGARGELGQLEATLWRIVRPR